LRLGQRETGEDAGPPDPSAGPCRVRGSQRNKDNEIGLALQDGDEQRKEAGYQWRCDQRGTAVYALATSYEHHDQRGGQQQVQGGHRVVGGAVIEEGERRYQQRVVGRMEIRQHDELTRWMWNDLELELLLQRQVVNGAAALEHEQPRAGIKGKEIRALKVSPNKCEPITHPEEKRPESGAGGCRVAHSAPAQ